jgi:hypothetical protein
MFELTKSIQKFSIEIKLFFLFNFLYFLEFTMAKEYNIIIVFAILLLFYFVRNLKYIKYLDKYYFFYFIYLFLLLIKGFYNANFKSYLFYDLVCFSTFFICLIVFRKKCSSVNNSFFLDIYPRAAYIVTIISLLFLLVFISMHGFTMASMEHGRGLDDLKTKLMSPKYFIGSSLFLYPLKSYIKDKIKRLVFDAAIVGYIFFSLAMSSRSTIIIGIMVMIATNINLSYKNINLSLMWNYRFISFILIVIFTILFLYQIPTIASATDYLILRFNEDESFGQARTEEANDILDGLALSEFLFGKGLGGSNTYWIFESLPNGVNSAHYGWMFLILKGGIFFAVFIYGIIISKIISFSRNKNLIPYAISLFAFLVLEYSHTNFNSFYNLSFMCIALAAFTDNVQSLDGDKRITY